MYPVPMNKTAAEARKRKMESRVPSSRIWKLTSEFKRRIQHVAVIAARWAAENPYTKGKS